MKLRNLDLRHLTPAIGNPVDHINFSIGRGGALARRGEGNPSTGDDATALATGAKRKKNKPISAAKPVANADLAAAKVLRAWPSAGKPTVAKTKIKRAK